MSKELGNNGWAGSGLLWLFVAANMLNYLDRYVLAAVLNPIGHELNLNDAQLGRLAMVFLLVYLIAAPFVSFCAEHFSRTKIVAVGILLWSVATALAAISNNYYTLLGTRALVGVGEAAYATLGPAILADLFPEKSRARVFTWFYLAIPVGSALGYALGGFVEGLAGWRMSFLVAGLPGLLLALNFWRLRDPEIGAQDKELMEVSQTVATKVASRSYLKKVLELFKSRVWLACTISYVGYSFAMGALSHWAPTLFQRLYGQSASTAGMVFGGIAVVTGIVGTFAGGQLTDKLQHRFPNVGMWISIVSLILAAPVMFFALQQKDLTAAYMLWSVGMLLLFVNTSPVNTVTVSCLHPNLRAAGMAVNIFLIHILGDAISPEIVGVASMNLGSSGNALAQALVYTIPAILLAGFALLFGISLRRKMV